jgi:hypothetical protein
LAFYEADQPRDNRRETSSGGGCGFATRAATLAGNLLEAPCTEATVRRRVEVVFEKLNDDMTLPQFRLAQVPAD